MRVMIKFLKRMVINGLVCLIAVLEDMCISELTIQRMDGAVQREVVS